MTQNQIRYLEALESQRSNLAKESETHRSNLAKEGETNRANLESERMAREKWDYEKYGSGKGDSVGGTIRTIKAAINDATKVVNALGNAINEAKPSVANNKTVAQRVGAETNSVDYGGLDLGAIGSSIKVDKLKQGIAGMTYDEVMNNIKSIRKNVRGTKEQIEAMLQPYYDRLDALKEQSYLEEYNRREG